MLQVAERHDRRPSWTFRVLQIPRGLFHESQKWRLTSLLKLVQVGGPSKRVSAVLANSRVMFSSSACSGIADREYYNPFTSKLHLPGARTDQCVPSVSQERSCTPYVQSGRAFLFFVRRDAGGAYSHPQLVVKLSSRGRIVYACFL